MIAKQLHIKTIYFGLKSTILLCFLLFIFLIPTNAVNAKDVKLKFDSARGWHLVKQFPIEVFVNFYKQGIAPFKATKQQWLIGTTVTAASFALITIDPNIDKQVSPLIHNNRLIGKTSPLITEIGGNYIIFPVAAFAITGMACKNVKMVETGLMALEAAIHAGVWIRIGKSISGRERPSAAYRSGVVGGYWYGPRLKNIWGGASVDAFPSGHTGTAFSIATVFAKQYNETWTVPLIAYTTATLVGLTRMTEHTHWASDVLLGAAVGYACARQVVKSHQQKTNFCKHQVSNFQITPIIGNNLYAFNVSMGF